MLKYLYRSRSYSDRHIQHDPMSEDINAKVCAINSKEFAEECRAKIFEDGLFKEYKIGINRKGEPYETSVRFA